MQKQAIIEEDEHLDDVEEVDQLLADQQAMQCSDWEKFQDADPVIKQLKALMNELGGVAPNKVQLRSKLAQVKSLCQHWNLLEIINGVATRIMKDHTGRKIYACFELFKRVHGYDAGLLVMIRSTPYSVNAFSGTEWPLT